MIVVGEALASHPDVDMISFTGSTRAGKRVGELASQSVKRVALELGGKSANIILDDADFEKAVTSGVSACYLNSGQTCSAQTRMLVPKNRQEEAVAIARRAAETFVPGSPHEQTTRLGPLVSATQRDRVRDYIVHVVQATRRPRDYGLGELAQLIEIGGSPRATLCLASAARAHAFIRHRAYVTPDDIKAIGLDVLRHRVAVSYEAEAEEVSSEDVIRRIFEYLPVP